jgi:hypothetical protein
MSFHVPEAGRDTTHPQLGTDASYGNNGAFTLPSPEPGWTLQLICSDGTEEPGLPVWEHVSVHAYRTGAPLPHFSGRTRAITMRTPTWKEMAFVKDTCWDGEDVVMQLHPKHSEYVNQHPHVLHLWRPVHETIPTPPSIFVGVR